MPRIRNEIVARFSDDPQLGLIPKRPNPELAWAMSRLDDLIGTDERRPLPLTVAPASARLDALPFCESLRENPRGYWPGHCPARILLGTHWPGLGQRLFNHGPRVRLATLQTQYKRAQSPDQTKQATRAEDGIVWLEGPHIGSNDSICPIVMPLDTTKCYFSLGGDWPHWGRLPEMLAAAVSLDVLDLPLLCPKHERRTLIFPKDALWDHTRITGAFCDGAQIYVTSDECSNELYACLPAGKSIILVLELHYQAYGGWYDRVIAVQV